MGSRMARRLVDAGHEVTVWNRTRSRAEPFAAAGACVADQPADAARASEVVITMVRDAAALAAVTEGADGVVAGLAPGSLLVDMSTVGPAAIRRLAEQMPDHAELLDAPVLGSLTEAEEGSLRIFVGGEEKLVERAKPLLTVLGEPLHIGPLGLGAAAKLVANSTLFGAIGVLGEAIALGESLGLSRESLFAVLAPTPVGAQAERRRAAFEAATYPPRFALALALKDAELVTEAAASAGLELRVAEAARAWLAEATDDDWGELDYSAVLARIAGQPRPSG
jgi:3-hydroxyisobutyrate dehydrogenase-like beta-hydroxyacid dehydrogenase